MEGKCGLRQVKECIASSPWPPRFRVGLLESTGLLFVPKPNPQKKFLWGIHMGSKSVIPETCYYVILVPPILS